MGKLKWGALIVLAVVAVITIANTVWIYNKPCPECCGTIDYEEKDFQIYEAVNIEMVLGKTAQYYAKFHYTPHQIDSFYGEMLAEGNTTDFAVLTKPLYHNDLSNVVGVILCDMNWRPLSPQPSVELLSYDPATYTLWIEGFPGGAQTNFRVAYYHGLPGTFSARYIIPPSQYDYTYPENVKGFPSLGKAEQWVTIASPVEAEPFQIKCIPVEVNLPVDCGLEAGDKFKFKIGIEEVGLNYGGVPVSAELQQWWTVTVRQEY